MTTEKLYDAIEIESSKNGFNLNGVWDKITYSAKMLMCERMSESGNWKNLPESVLEHTIECELVL